MSKKVSKKSPALLAEHEHVRTGLSPTALKAAFQDNLNYVVGRPMDVSTSTEDRFHAIALTLRDRIMQRWIKEVERKRLTVPPMR